MDMLSRLFAIQISISCPTQMSYFNWKKTLYINANSKSVASFHAAMHFTTYYDCSRMMFITQEGIITFLMMPTVDGAVVKVYTLECIS